ncbi:unnamed protein product [Darwinula stevensoni]|uniref:Uncharacterized protein n=1 Tax=Darwinula stevensoni TaxID=69355 RepID=A0A7R9FNP8_9CRUS|nr:unnamed protein product [Darwinula stevensoni]CAG0896619.1 unnamed protein product [Darwinula stevensoni]
MRVNMGCGETKPFIQASEEYRGQFYPEAEQSHYSFPPGPLLPDDELNKLLSKAKKEEEKADGEDVPLPEHYTAKENVLKPILTKDDLHNVDSFKKFLKRNCVDKLPTQAYSKEEIDTRPKEDGEAMKKFLEIFSLYICAASSVDLPRTQLEHSELAEKQMQKTLIFLTPEQKKHIDDDESWLLLIGGGSGTGKTIVVKERAKRLAKDADVEVLVVNLPGGGLTDYFKHEFQELNGIRVLDGRDKGIPEDREGIFAFLQKEGKNKHILLDEVPLTLGIQDKLDEESLSVHWKEISKLEGSVKSLTFAFRPNDATYTKDINLEDINISGVRMKVLNIVKRNTRCVSELFLALGNYSRRIFVCEEPTIRDMDLHHSKNQSLPTLFPISSCRTIHASCKNKSTCAAIRSAKAVITVLKCNEIAPEKQLYAIVDSMDRRNRLVYILASVFRIEAKFLDSRGRLLTKQGNPSKIIVVTDDQILGYHGKDIMIIIDFSECKWKNYLRLISSGHDNVIIVIEEEELQMGKYFQMSVALSDPMDNMSNSLKNKIVPDSTKEKFQEGLTELLKMDLKLEKELSPKDIIDHDLVDGARRKKYSSIHICVDDYSIQGVNTEEEKKKWERVLDNLDSKLKLTIVLKSHSKRGREISIEELSSFFKNRKVKVTRLSKFPLHSSFTSSSLLNHIYKNEVHTPLRLDAKNLPTASRPVLTGIGDLRTANGEVHVLVPDEKLMTFLDWFSSCSFSDQKIRDKQLKFVHPKDFRGCESSVSITVNVDDRWLLESMSRSRTDLFIIDFLPDHQPTSTTQEEKENWEKVLGNLDPKLTWTIVFSSHSKRGREISMKELGSFFQSQGVKKIRDKQLKFVHPKDFRGCESSVSITVNVDDRWLLESMSRSRTDLFIIDFLPDHQPVWQTMKEEGLLEILEVDKANEEDIDEHILLEMDCFGNFL